MQRTRPPNSVSASPLISVFYGRWGGHVSCVLRAGGARFDVDAFLATSPWTPASVRRPNVARLGRSSPGKPGFTVLVSEAGLEDFKGQVDGAVAFIDRCGPEIVRLAAFPGVDGLDLDFGIKQRGLPAETDTFPAVLARRAGELGLDLTISRYAIEGESE